MKIVVLKIVSFNRARGFGFAIGADDPRKVFLHINNHSKVFVSKVDICLNGFCPANKYPKKDDVICAEVMINSKGFIAVRWVFDQEFLQATAQRKNSAHKRQGARPQQGPRSFTPPTPQKETRWWIILGFTHNRITLAELRSQYRSLVKIHHPDYGGNHDIMAEINSAYQTALLAIR